MKTESVNITPALAREWLKGNAGNRALRPSHVETLRISFSRGEFVTTHQGIAFDADGEIIDGQHRLTAISMMPEGFAAKMLVTWGLDREKAFPVIDATQAKRSTSDVLRVDRSVGETANFLARIYSGGFSGITPTFVAPFAEFVKVEIADLVKFCPSATRTWSSAPVKAAAVLRMKSGDPDYVKLVYSSMVRREFETMPKIAQSLFKAYMTGTVRASAATDIFARCLKVFDPMNATLSKIQINDPSSAIEETRALLNDQLFGQKCRVSTEKVSGIRHLVRAAK